MTADSGLPVWSSKKKHYFFQSALETCSRNRVFHSLGEEKKKKAMAKLCVKCGKVVICSYQLPTLQNEFPALEKTHFDITATVMLR